MASYADRDDIRAWKDRIVRGFKSRQDKYDRWILMRDYYLGYYLSGPPNSDQYVVNWVFSAVRQMTATLYMQNPKFYVRPLTPTAEPAVPVWESLLDFEYKYMDGETQDRRMLIDALLYGTGIQKHGFYAEYGVEDPLGENPPGGHDIADYGDEGRIPQGPFTEHNTAIKPGHPWKKTIPPFDFLVDPDATCYEECRWVVHRFRRPWIDVVRDRRYDKRARAELKPTGKSIWYHDEPWNESREDSRLGRNEAGMCTLYEIFDRRRRRIIVVSDGCEQPLMDIPFALPIDDPYTILQFFEDETSFWGIPWVDTFSDQVEALNKARTQMWDHLRRWGQTRGAYQVGVMSAQDAFSLANTTQGFLAPVLSNPKEGIHIIDPPQMSGDAWRLTELMQRDMDEVSGVSEMARGTSSVNTATEASFIQAQSGLRVGDMRHMLDRALRNSLRKVAKIIRGFYGPDRVVPIAGPGGAYWQFVQLSPMLLQADLDIDIEPGSTERIDKNVRVRQITEAMDRLMAMDPLLQQQGYIVNWAEMAKDFLKQTEVVKNPDKLIMQLPPMPPMMPPHGGDMGGGAPMGPPPGQPPGMATPPGFGNNMPAPTNVNNMGAGAMPWETNAAAMGNAFSQVQFQRAPTVTA